MQSTVAATETKSGSLFSLVGRPGCTGVVGPVHVAIQRDIEGH